VILFADDGELSYLEYGYFDRPFADWPESRVRVLGSPTDTPASSPPP
jgi:hypothetical protein